MDKKQLIDKVLEEIKKDIEKGDLTCIECLLENVDEGALLAYLPEGDL